MQTFTLAVPDLASYSPHTGIGRVFHSLYDQWKQSKENPILAVPAKYQVIPLPLLRNFPFGLDLPPAADLVLLPKITGAGSLRYTSKRPSLAVVHDIGTIDEGKLDRLGMDWLTYLSILHGFYGLQHATHLVTDSEFTRQRLLHYLPKVAAHTTVIHAGVSELFYSQPKEVARSIIAQAFPQPSLSSPVLLYVGSERPRKNLKVLLRAFQQLKTFYPAAQLLKVGAAGHPNFRQETLALAKGLGLQVGKDLLILENPDDALLAVAYAAADLFVSASLYEGFGLPALEAMAVGTPVVVSNCGSFPEVVGEGGVVIPPTEEAFVLAMREVLEDPQREARVQRGKLRAAQFTWALAAERYVALFQALTQCAPKA